MTTFFSDYSWKDGKPVGKCIINQNSDSIITPSYKIVIDPYYKRISVECYHAGIWNSVVYDSALLDFRKLNERDQLAWQKDVMSSSSTEVVCLIRDHEDRVVCLEKHQLKDHIPVGCEIFSPHGIYLAHQKMYYTEWGDPFNGVTLSDSTGRLVLKKIYATDSNSFEFTDLLQETHEEK